MNDAVETEPELLRAAPPPIPSPWRSIETLGAALDVLEANPDLQGPDIVLALQSEVPDALALVDAMVATIKYREAMAVATRAALRKLGEQMSKLAQRDEAAGTQLRLTLQQLVRQLRLSTPHRTPFGPISQFTRPGSVEVPDPSVVPELYWKRSLDMAAIAAAVDKDPDITWAYRGEDISGIRIG